MCSLLQLSANEKQSAIVRFQQYLKIRTVHPEPDYETAVKFLCKQAARLDLPCERLDVYSGKPVVIMTWSGKNPGLPTLMLNSHTDVVPVYPDQWKFDPFGAHIDENGDIYARGSQDMKCVGMQYLEAVFLLKRSGYVPERTIYLTFVPEEELAGKLGMEIYCKHADFVKMNVGCCLDEGLANPTDKFTVFYGERSVWWLKITAKGNPGHGSRLLENTAGEKICRFLQKVDEFRRSQKQQLDRENNVTLGDVTTLNLTQMSGGLQTNVIPAELVIQIDCRISPKVNLKHFEQELFSWCEYAGSDVTLEFTQKHDSDHFTDITEANPWWKSFSSACRSLNLDVVTEIFPAATDSRFLRALGINAIGFSPMNNTPILLHDHNEFLNKDIYVRGIEYYTVIIPYMASA